MNAARNSNPKPNGHEAYFEELRGKLAATAKGAKKYLVIANAPFSNKLITAKLGLGLVAIVMLDKATKKVNGMAISDTESELGAIKMTSERFEDMSIPLHDPENLVAKAIRNGHHQETNDWYYMFVPEFSPDQARFVQAGLGIASSVIYPVNGGKHGGAIVFSYFKPLKDIGKDQHSFMRSYVDLAASLLKG
jgi:hypothetical protein